MVLKYVKNQTEDICLAAVKKSGNRLCDAKHQTEKICLAAARECGYALLDV